MNIIFKIIITIRNTKLNYVSGIGIKVSVL